MKNVDDIRIAVESALGQARDLSDIADDIYSACDSLGDSLSEDYADDAVCAASSLVGALDELSRTLQM